MSLITVFGFLGIICYKIGQYQERQKHTLKLHNPIKTDNSKLKNANEVVINIKKGL